MIVWGDVWTIALGVLLGSVAYEFLDGIIRALYNFDWSRGRKKL